MKFQTSYAVLRTLAGAALLFFGSSVAAQSLGSVISADIKKNDASAASQKRVDSIVAQTDKLEGEYRQTLKETDGLNVYIELLESQVANQQREMDGLAASEEKVAVIERQILPQMKKMIDNLEDFIKLDVPFLEEERADRIVRLNALLARADVSVAEKFRSVVESYQIEANFGRDIEAVKGELEVDGQTFAGEFLRIGRIGLYWQSTDAAITRAYDHKSGAWRDLGNEYRSAVRAGLQIANKQKAPDLLMLPVPAPEAI